MPEETEPDEPAVPYQALYRRFRPQRFADVLGQEHVTRALVGAVRDDRAAHAYLFSGPRGTGKTSTARILAMALNCESPKEGEPDGTCPSCIAIRQGASMDVQELDAATNRGIDDVRDLLSRVALGNPGRWKVYIIDEVHQLSPQASTALLKTLEEPPGHVIFVLATTDPQKVLPTIRSRTQHYEFRLLGPEVLGSLLHDVAKKASLDLPPDVIDRVVGRGRGSARDALSALDQVAAAGGLEEDVGAVADLVGALAEHDTGRVLVLVAEAAQAGLDPRGLAMDLLQYLRNGFLATTAKSLVLLADEAAEEARVNAEQMGKPAVVRAMELLGQAVIDMRESPDSRTTLEVALVRVSAPELDDSRSALLERIERIERAISAKGSGSVAPSPAPPQPALPASSPAPSAPGSPERGGHDRPADTAPESEPPRVASQPALGAHRAAAATSSASPPPEVIRSSAAEGTPAEPSTAGSEGGPLPSREELTLAWGDAILPSLRPNVKVYVSTGRFLSVGATVVLYAVPDRGLLARAQAGLQDLEAALRAHFGRPVPIELVLDEQDGSSDRTAGPAGLRASASRPAGGQVVAELADFEDGTDYDISEMEEAPSAIVSPEQRLLEAFPGVEEVTP